MVEEDALENKKKNETNFSENRRIEKIKTQNILED